MKKTRLLVVALLSLAVALPILAWTYKYTYPIACKDLWPAVKVVVSNPDNYIVKTNDDVKMTASYNVKHQIHVTITETVLQRTNKVTLVPKGTGCEMQVVSNYSGVEHNDREDFKKRVDEALVAPKDTKPADPATPVK
ncbi:MAG TPA: hypothetical protein VGF61_24570 [Candidatus Acidoferrum sp.]|jgi:hypothetical protein